MEMNYDEQKKLSIKEDYIVNKPNPLLVVRDNMKIMQARFFNAYLSKVNPTDEKTYKVSFSLSAFCNLLDVDASSISRIREAADGVLRTQFDFRKYVEKFGEQKLDPLLMKKVNLFESFEIMGSASEGYLVEISPTRPMEQLLRNQVKYGYVTYELQNTINLSSIRYMRMYECFKRHLGKGLTISIPILKSYLGIDEDDYPETKVFIRDVLKKGINELNNKTDLYIQYENVKKGRRIVGFNFIITSQKRKSELVLEENSNIGLMEYSLDDITSFNKNNPVFDVEFSSECE